MNREAASPASSRDADCLRCSLTAFNTARVAMGRSTSPSDSIKVWGFLPERRGRPAAASTRIEDTLIHVGPGTSARSRPPHRPFARPGMELDPGGIGKGYAVDRMVEVLERAGVRITLVCIRQQHLRPGRAA